MLSWRTLFEFNISSSHLLSIYNLILAARIILFHFTLLCIGHLQEFLHIFSSVITLQEAGKWFSLQALEWNRHLNRRSTTKRALILINFPPIFLTIMLIGILDITRWIFFNICACVTPLFSHRNLFETSLGIATTTIFTSSAAVIINLFYAFIFSSVIMNQMLLFLMCLPAIGLWL